MNCHPNKKVPHAALSLTLSRGERGQFNSGHDDRVIPPSAAPIPYVLLKRNANPISVCLLSKEEIHDGSAYYCCRLAFTRSVLHHDLPGHQPSLAVAPAVPSGYYLKWGDEFNGNALDLNIWSQQHPDWPNLNSWSVGDGTLKLTTYTDSNGVDHGGYITSGLSYERTYGYFAASIKFQEQPGTCSAYWMTAWNAYTAGDPAVNGTEMDIIEHRARDGKIWDGDVSNRDLITVHWPANDQTSAQFYSGNIGINDGNFHLYSMLWTPTAYTFYFDNTLLWTCNQPISQSNEFTLLDCIPNGDSSFVGSRPAGGYGPLGSASNAVMTVDYVRDYARTTARRRQPGRHSGRTGPGNTGGELSQTRHRNPSQLWAQGDFNGDGVVDIQDLAILAANYRHSLASDVVPAYDGLDAAAIELLSLAGVTVVAEPGTLMLLVVGLVGLLAYAWRRRNYLIATKYALCLLSSKE